MKILTLMFAFIVVIQLSACNTMRGVGKDVERSGEAIQKSTN
ncbi:entericidin A/B family lipoprotein [Nitrosomonas supralitoralis]|uniref:Entericidin EcnA/B family protein n=1 Tax=Nitrosomonas supralitoralis TaxID=2116706 RepID=A0A2P7NSV1_9PROT|nr:entericidin A/B family lipoprotein [Nitrosomonas supralitoralis]PSJ16540.1 entericidin EcnA/B family protein [Nitrosomonas supralitoralis]